MLRIKLSGLISESHKYFYNGQPFTGIGFELLADGKCQAFEYSQGIQVEKYIDQYFSSSEYSANKYLNSIDSSHLVPEYDKYDNETGIFRYQGKNFSGIAYFFKGEYCIGEALYDDGWICDEVYWYPSGKLSTVNFAKEDFEQDISWNKDGNVKEFRLTIDGEYGNGIYLKFTEFSKIGVLSIDAGAFSRLQMIKDKIKCKEKINFNFFESKDFAREFIADSSIVIGGLDVDDEVFDGLRACDGLKKVEKMILSKSSLSAESIRKLSKESSLKYLFVRDKREFLPQALKQFKQARPDCIILLNDREIKA